jgi:hypothetical protein
VLDALQDNKATAALKNKAQAERAMRQLIRSWWKASCLAALKAAAEQQDPALAACSWRPDSKSEELRDALRKLVPLSPAAIAAGETAQQKQVEAKEKRQADGAGGGSDSERDGECSRDDGSDDEQEQELYAAQIAGGRRWWHTGGVDCCRRCCRCCPAMLCDRALRGC